MLSATAWTREQFQWLAAEIAELPGAVLLWAATLLLPSQEERLIIRRLQHEYGALPYLTRARCGLAGHQAA